MKPRQAAAVIDKMDRSTAVSLLKSMSPRDSANVLGALPPSTAAEIAAAMVVP